MTRRFIDDIRTDIDTDIVTAGGITALQMNSILNDMCDSLIQDETAIQSTSPTLGIVTAATFTDLTTTYDVNIGGDGSFLIPAFGAGTVTTSAIAGFTYLITANLSFTDLGVGIPVDFTVRQNGVAVGVAASATGDGNGDPVSLTLRYLELSATASDVWTIAVETPAGADTIDILAITMAVVIQPTNNP